MALLTFDAIKAGLEEQASRLPGVISAEDAEALLSLLPQGTHETTLDAEEVFEGDIEGIALQTAADVITRLGADKATTDDIRRFIATDHGMRCLLTGNLELKFG